MASQPLILLVDDHEANLQALAAVLEPIDVRMAWARSGREALKMALNESDEVALVLLDLVMPDMDGVQVTRQLKNLSQTRHLPIVLLTAIGRDVDCKFAGYSAGAVDFLNKPFDPWELRAKVGFYADVHLTKRAQQRAMRDLQRDAEAADRLLDATNRGLLFALEQAERPSAD